MPPSMYIPSPSYAHNTKQTPKINSSPESSTSTTTRPSPSDTPIIKLAHNIRQSFRFEPLPRWSLEHKISRETGPVAAPSPTTSTSSSAAVPATATQTPAQSPPTHPATRFLQCPTLSRDPKRTWVGIAAAAATATAVIAATTNDTANLSQPTSTAVATGLQPTATATTSNGSQSNAPNKSSDEPARSTIPTSSLEEFSSLLT